MFLSFNVKQRWTLSVIVLNCFIMALQFFTRMEDFIILKGNILFYKINNFSSVNIAIFQCFSTSWWFSHHCEAYFKTLRLGHSVKLCPLLITFNAGLSYLMASVSVNVHRCWKFYISGWRFSSSIFLCPLLHRNAYEINFFKYY